VPLQNVGQLRGGVDLEGLCLRVQFRLLGREHDVTARGLELLAIGFQRAGVGVKVFVRGKLQTVHEDGRDRHIAQWLGLAHQRQMSCVQVAHGGYDGRVAELVQRFAQRVNRVNQLHGRQDVTRREWCRPESCHP
jgi:hypothetical protein